MALLFAALLTKSVSAHCSGFQNLPDTMTNAGCNYAGTCYEEDGDSFCICCELDKTTLKPLEVFEGEPDCPGWAGGHYYDTIEVNGNFIDCGKQKEYTAVYGKYYIAPDTPNYPTCVDSKTMPAEILAELQKFYDSAKGTAKDPDQEMSYGGKLVSTQCRECTRFQTCTFCTGRDCVTKDTGMMLEVGTDYHTFYNLDCFRPEKPVPSIYYQEFCPDNFDQGYKASLAWARVRDAGGAVGVADFKAVNAALGMSITRSEHVQIFNEKDISVRTLAPTPAPTYGDPCFMGGFTHQIDDIRFLAVAESCRGGLQEEWPGEKTCQSPYMVCLPGANTDNQAPKNPAITSKDHRYTVDECKFECAWDQRCKGFEFEADPDSTKGDCRLIDDIPVEPEVPGNYNYDPSDTSLHKHETGSKVLCFHKHNHCHPKFAAADLSDDMLNCYCPNNRKGFYTKRVKRTVQNTRFCNMDEVADVDEINERIKLAHANRMFHLCENWCLFNMEDPTSESWYWNPWKKCWRKQDNSPGPHASYCQRVITGPETIEQTFINERAKKFCQA